MNEAEILARWSSDRPIYKAWADFVCTEICLGIEADIAPTTMVEFLKVPVVPRLKEPKSLVDKALFRKKEYTNPYEDITDKVGIRFVVLLTSDIKKVEKFISTSVNWDYSKDRDFEEDRKLKPMEFSYQSVHYVVRAVREIDVANLIVPIGTPCEIQVRTLLQHAHSELTHDSIYKSKKTSSTKTQRTVAKSMALIEATDDFFELVVADINEATIPEREALIILQKLYAEQIKLMPEKQISNILIVDAFSDKIGDNLEGDLVTFLQSKPYIIDKVIERAIRQHLYRQPAILLAYMMSSMLPAGTKERWPMTLEELRSVYSDLGLSIDSY